MCKLVIEGGRPLQGTIDIQGAKNAALPVLAACVLCESPCVIHNCPGLLDVDASCKILKHLGCRVKKEKGTVTVDPTNVAECSIPDALMREMRSSIVFLGAIAARLGQARISFPGGCELGPRPIDLHLAALRKLGLVINEGHGFLDCHCTGRLHGETIALSFPSVGATENILLAAVTAEGLTTIINAAREPEIADLASFLNRCGAKIRGAGESVVEIEGVDALHGSEHRVIPDRIVATTYMTAAAVTGGELELRGVQHTHLSPVVPVFLEAGCAIRADKENLFLRAVHSLHPLRCVRTMPYPGFPTDAQAPVMAMSTLAEGNSLFVENIFENRYKHVPELVRMGASIKLEGKVAVVEGVRALFGAPVVAADLRGGAALVVAGLAAEGTTEVTGLHHIDRGYTSIEQDLASVGARIRRVSSVE
ncbi:MAG: UDP-N-acetylglucosamine 1-carboxyvinyltransferase [Ethanoligenens sp.]